MKRLLIILLLLWKSSTGQVIYFDNMESTGYTWRGVPKVLVNSGYVSGLSAASDLPSNSPKYSSSCTSFQLLGAGLGSSSIEKDTLYYANVSGLDPGSVYQFRLKAASFGISPAINAAAGVDASDYVEISYNSNGGSSYTKELKLVGSSNSIWDFSISNAFVKNASGSLTTVTTAPYSRLWLTLPAGLTQASFLVTVAANASGESWQIDDVELVKIGVLPIDLIQFSAEAGSSSNILTWETASETNNDYFLIERSTDAFSFEKIGTVDGAGTTSSMQAYRWEDFDSCEGVIYYRLTQVDYDGIFETFAPIALRCKTYHDRVVIKIVNCLGEEVDNSYKGPVIYLYDDGSVERQIRATD